MRPPMGPGLHSSGRWLAGPPPCRADHSRKNSRSLMKTNHEWTQIDTNTDGPPSTTSGTKMLLQFCALGVTMSWDDGFLGARASRPHKAWHSLGHLPHLDQSGTAPWLSFGLADAVPADRVAACSIALKLSGGQRDRMRAGRPRSQAMPSRRCGGGCLAGDFSESCFHGLTPTAKCGRRICGLLEPPGWRPGIFL